MPYFTSIQSGAYEKMYSDSPCVVETGIIISKYEAKCFVADSFLKIVVVQMPKKAFNLAATGRRYRLDCHTTRIISDS